MRRTAVLWALALFLAAGPALAAEVLGVWRNNGDWEGGPCFKSTITIYEKDGELYVDEEFDDAGLSTSRLVEKPSRRGRRFDLAPEDQSQAGDYYVLVGTTLEFYDRDGLIGRARQIQGPSAPPPAAPAPPPTAPSDPPPRPRQAEPLLYARAEVMIKHDYERRSTFALGTLTTTGPELFGLRGEVRLISSRGIAGRGAIRFQEAEPSLAKGQTLRFGAAAPRFDADIHSAILVLECDQGRVEVTTIQVERME